MSSEDPSLRNRKPHPAAVAVVPGKDKNVEEEVSGISFVDVLRVLSGILLLSTLLSWFVTDGDSFTWGYKSASFKWKNVKLMFVRFSHFPAGYDKVTVVNTLQNTPLNLSDTELMRYNGEDPNLPVYVAVNGSVFDVSSNRITYGPGGGYGFFAGRDAARAYVSGCFAEDLTWDLRGVEEQFIKGAERDQDEAELDEIEALTASGENDGRARYLTKRREKRRTEARKKVEQAISHWDAFFRNHDKYFYVGKVTHPDLSEEPIRPMCKGQQEKGREERKGTKP